MAKLELKIKTTKTIWFHILFFSAYTGVLFRFLGVKPIMIMHTEKKKQTIIKVNFKKMEVVND